MILENSGGDRFLVRKYKVSRDDLFRVYALSRELYSNATFIGERLDQLGLTVSVKTENFLGSRMRMQVDLVKTYI